MISTLIKVVLYAVLIIVLSYLIPNIAVDVFWPTAVIVGLAFALFNAIVRAILPGGIIFLVVMVILNAVAFWLLGMYLGGFDVYTIGAAVLGSIIASFGIWLINEVF